MTATSTCMTVTTSIGELANQACALVDKTLSDLRGVNIANAQEMTDVLLDIRIFLARITEEG